MAPIVFWTAAFDWLDHTDEKLSTATVPPALWPRQQQWGSPTAGGSRLDDGRHSRLISP